ncbi:MAG: HAD family hydrolase [Bacillota bacterium]
MDLYVSDLDGTLLNSQKQLCSETIQTINDLIMKGLNFTVATARSYESAGRLIEPLKLKLPIIVHNGVYVYDIAAGRYILENFMNNEETIQIIKLLKDNGLSPIIFARDKNNESKVFYKGVYNHGEEHYFNDRKANNDKRLTLVDEIHIESSLKIVSILAIDSEERLFPTYKSLMLKYDMIYHYMEDIYSKCHWLEITHRNANKRKAVEFLKNYIGAERVVCFGDNLNDCSMFEIADSKYAVENAVDDLKKFATKVIGSNDSCGVARCIKDLFEKGLQSENTG